MQFLTSFVLVALIVQLISLTLLAICLGSQAVHRIAVDLWNRFSGRKTKSGHSH